ncbi:MAG: hypothetical protein J0H43_02205 [Actinobacteria bacterium]|nr:hypothetical protein [Actinomycetota bacterium]
MEPNSNFLLVLLLLAAGGLIFAAIKFRLVLVKIASGLLAMVLSMTAGMAIVNDYYGYYQSWSQISADLSGSYASYNSKPVANRTADEVVSGELTRITLAGAKSGIQRDGLLYLPPQYFQKAFAHTRFPVLELFHGSPGQPTDWTVHMGLEHTLDRMIAQHLIGPMIVVMPAINGASFEDCVDAPGALDDTYLTQDVRTDILRSYRASTVPAEWGVGGFSSGGYCAANLSLRHRAAFGAAAIMDGYFRPTDGPAAGALGDNPAALAVNDPLDAARQLPVGAAPLPSFWISVGTGDRADLAAAQAFAAALHGVEQVNLVREPGVGHNFNAWRAAVPPLLTWMWSQIADPALRVLFPVTGGVLHSTLLVGAVPPARHHGKAKRPGPTSIAKGAAPIVAARATSSASLRPQTSPSRTASPLPR